MRSQLFGADPVDALSYLAPVPVLLLSALAACLWPVRRATAASVLDVLRGE
jgi:ABC-type lipoprotein release transport system permease subunit